MHRRNRAAGAALAIGMAAGAPAGAATLSADYLAGKWTTGSKDACTKLEHEQTVFRKDGTFATEHNGKAVAVGFWRIDDDRLDMHILASPASLGPPAQEHLVGGYGYVPVTALLFDVADDNFRMVQSVGGALQGLNVFRCP
jgi:hypothetical protein